MRTTWRIARLELSFFFYSPIAWLVSIVFFIQAAMQFCGKIHNVVMSVLKGGTAGEASFYTFSTPMAGLFVYIQDPLVLLIPMLTMGVFSRELSNGSIRLLQSSPVRPVQIVAGKFLGLAGYGLLLSALLLLLCIVGRWAIEHHEMTRLLCGLLGLYLLMCAYMAIGLFMSSLTSHQMVAAISTITLFAALYEVGGVGQDVPLLRDITDFLSVGGHTMKLYVGLLSSKDIAYYLLIIILFLGLVVLNLEHERRQTDVWLKAGRITGLVAVVLAIGYVVSRPTLLLYIDTSARKELTLTPDVQHILKKVKDPVKIHIYNNILDDQAWRGLPDAENYMLHDLEPYQRFLPAISLDFTYYYDSSRNEQLFKDNPGLNLRQLAERMANVYRLDMASVRSPQQMKKTIDLSSEEYRFIRQIESGGKKSFIRTWLNPTNGEAEMAAAFKRIVDSALTICFVTGHGERDIDKGADDGGYKLFVREPTLGTSLSNNGFDVGKISLATQEIPEGLTALIIADAKTPYSKQELQKLERYIAAGGNLLLCGEPGQHTAMAAIDSLVGISLAPGMLVQESADYAPQFIQGLLHPWLGRRSKVLQRHLKDSSRIEAPGATSLIYAGVGGYHLDTLMLTDPSTTWLRPAGMHSDTGRIRFTPGKGDTRAAYPLALALTRKSGERQQLIVVTGDADWLDNLAMRKSQANNIANYDLGIDVFKWFSYEAYPIDVTRPGATERLRITRPQFKVMRLILLWILPGLLLATGVAILTYRKRK